MLYVLTESVLTENSKCTDQEVSRLGKCRDLENLRPGSVQPGSVPTGEGPTSESVSTEKRLTGMCPDTPQALKHWIGIPQRFAGNQKWPQMPPPVCVDTLNNIFNCRPQRGLSMVGIIESGVLLGQIVPWCLESRKARVSENSCPILSRIVFSLPKSRNHAFSPLQIFADLYACDTILRAYIFWQVQVLVITIPGTPISMQETGSTKCGLHKMCKMCT